MTSRPLLIFDFDGVIIDGMHEYWWSARQACISLLPNNTNAISLPHDVPITFRQLRPWVHKGWEMVLVAAELSRPDSALIQQGAKAFSTNYNFHCHQALKQLRLNPSQLQNALEDVRKEAIKSNLSSWLALHRPFASVLDRLKTLNNEGVELGVLTTKGKDFTAELLHSFHLKPTLLYGHESGTKPSVLQQLQTKRVLRGFVEDRRATLETVLNTPGLSSLPCYLANWGYLKPTDKNDLSPGIHLLDLKTLATPLANWP